MCLTSSGEDNNQLCCWFKAKNMQHTLYKKNNKTLTRALSLGEKKDWRENVGT